MTEKYLNYSDKICVVTGAGSGMGEATAKMLVELGAKVYALDIREVALEGIEEYIHVDLSDKDSIDQAFPETAGEDRLLLWCGRIKRRYSALYDRCKDQSGSK